MLCGEINAMMTWGFGGIVLAFFLALVLFFLEGVT